MTTAVGAVSLLLYDKDLDLLYSLNPIGHNNTNNFVKFNIQQTASVIIDITWGIEEF